MIGETAKTNLFGTPKEVPGGTAKRISGRISRGIPCGTSEEFLQKFPQEFSTVLQ